MLASSAGPTFSPHLVLGTKRMGARFLEVDILSGTGAGGDVIGKGWVEQSFGILVGPGSPHFSRGLLSVLLGVRGHEEEEALGAARVGKGGRGCSLCSAPPTGSSQPAGVRSSLKRA